MTVIGSLRAALVLFAVLLTSSKNFGCAAGA